MPPQTSQQPYQKRQLFQGHPRSQSPVPPPTFPFRHISWKGQLATCAGRAVLAGVCGSLCGPAMGQVAGDRGSQSAATDRVAAALKTAGSNRQQLEAALSRTPPSRQPAMRFLLGQMPDSDLRTLDAEFLLEHVEYAYRARAELPWGRQIPEQYFLEYVVPYACVNERRDAWRKDFFARLPALVRGATSAAEAAVMLNQKMFQLFKVRYSTQRPKPDQSPYESIEAGVASCTGLSILLVDACRAVAVPARFVGTPQWTDGSGNHSWVEVWDQGWHFTGAGEPRGDRLNQAWFTVRASKSLTDHPQHAIYAASFRRTPLTFPLAWRTDCDTVYALNVTARYAGRASPLPVGTVGVLFRAVDPMSKQRCQARLRIRDASGRMIFSGQTNDERFDGNDHVRVPLRRGQSFQVEAEHAELVFRGEFIARRDGQLETLWLRRETATSSDSASADGAP